MRWTNPFARWQRRDDFQVQGLQVKGDSEVLPTPTNPLKLFWYAHFVWRTVAVLEVPIAEIRPRPGLRTLEHYFIGFRNFHGKIYVRRTPIYERQFGVRVGHEPCTFFALASDGLELPLRKIEVTDTSDRDYRHLRLY